MNKLNSLSKFLSREGLEKESSEILSILKLARTDEDLGAMADFQDLPAAERKKRMSNLSIYKTLTPKQRSDAAHGILDAVGLVPGPGDVADVLNAILYANEGQYALAALSLICLVPAIGSAFGAAKLAKKTLPAKLIFEHADEIEKVVSKIVTEIPNGQLVKQAVDQIISNAKIGMDVSLETGKSVIGSASKSSDEIVTKLVDPKNAWYMNPRWQEWFSSIMRSALTTALNEVTERGFKTRLMKGIYNKRALDKLRVELAEYGLDEFSRNKVIEGNTELIKRISQSIPSIVENLKANIKIKLITRVDQIDPQYKNILGLFDHNTTTILIYLPNYSHLITNPSLLIDNLEATILHEVWHAIDSRIIKSLDRDMEHYLPYGSQMSSSGNVVNDSFKSIMDSLKSIFKYDRISNKSFAEYMRENSEIYVRIKSLRRASKKILKKELGYDELLTFVREFDNKKYNIPGDAEDLLRLLNGCSDDEIKNAALLMNKFP